MTQNSPSNVSSGEHALITETEFEVHDAVSVVLSRFTASLAPLKTAGVQSLLYLFCAILYLKILDFMLHTF